MASFCQLWPGWVLWALSALVGLGLVLTGLVDSGDADLGDVDEDVVGVEDSGVHGAGVDPRDGESTLLLVPGDAGVQAGDGDQLSLGDSQLDGGKLSLDLSELCF